MIHSLRRSSSRNSSSGSKPSLVSFKASPYEEQENWYPGGKGAQYNIRRKSFEHSSAANKRATKKNQQENYYSVRTPYDRNQNNGPLEYKPPGDLAQQYFSNNPVMGQEMYPRDTLDCTLPPSTNYQHSMKNRLPRTDMGYRQGLHPQTAAMPKYQDNSKYLTQTRAINKTVGGVIKRRKHVVLLGLDGSGKTTILMQLKYRCFIASTPTVGFNHEKVWGGGFRWSVWDVGGGERLRPLWSTYSRGTDGIVFVVDASCNSDTMEEARLELARILKLTKVTASQLHKPAPPLLVLANFQDNSMARNAPEVAESLCLPQEGAGPAMASLWAVACVCAITGEGLDDALATLRQLMDSQKTKTQEKWKY